MYRNFYNLMKPLTFIPFLFLSLGVSVQDMRLHLPFLTPRMKLHIVGTANRRISNPPPAEEDSLFAFSEFLFRFDRPFFLAGGGAET
jgi:hypothetical protein